MRRMDTKGVHQESFSSFWYRERRRSTVPKGSLLGCALKGEAARGPLGGRDVRGDANAQRMQMRGIE